VKKELARKLSILENVPEGASPKLDASASNKLALLTSARSSSESEIITSSTRKGTISARQGDQKVVTGRSVSNQPEFTERGGGGEEEDSQTSVRLTMRTNRSNNAVTGRTARSEKERSKLIDEVKNLEKKLSQIENMLEAKSTQSARSARSNPSISARSVKISQNKSER
jgi:hypothetical protein